MEIMTSTKLCRAQGCMLGSAIGDALGTTVEFYPAMDPYNPEVTDIVGGGIFNLNPGEWTDDTSLALCLADSLLSKKRLDLSDQLQRYVRWMREGENSSNGVCFDIGNTTRNALERFERNGEPYAGGTMTYSSGNGSLMRLAPIPVAAPSLDTAIQWAGEQSKTTHNTEEAIHSCQVFAAMMYMAIEGCSKEEILNCRSITTKSWTEKVDAIVNGSFKAKEPPEINGSGYVINTLEAVLWAFNKSSNFKDGAILVVNLGKDADTTGAIYGALAGAYYGITGIPEKWRATVAWSDHIKNLATQLFQSRGEMDIA
eukprot:gb/GECG01007207.1/.p1 GENE.gb/GECG01007207.1/~~gb/GECG01007207.1/.p1  ORF type:complete len:313 (+),score=33.75 gb/GECG01007207.1/:1-939(+)